MFSDDDDDTVNPSTRRNLSSIFGTDNTNFEDALQNAGAQERRSASQQKQAVSSQQSQALAVVIVKVVQCYVLENNMYKSKGKLGAAILGNNDVRYYRLLLYKDKSTHVTQAQISGKFWFNVQKNNYATFYDKNNTLWSILFENTSDLIEFCIEIALSRWRATEFHDTVVSQDLDTMENDDKVKQGDRVNVNYIAWPILASHKIGKEFESKGSLTTIVSFEKHWEKALIGISDRGKRVLILPGLLLDGWETTIGRRCPDGLVIQITVERCPSADTKSNQDLVLPALPTDDFSSSDVDRKKKHNKDNSKKSSQESSRASKQDLITRMGKLGKPALPLTGAKPPAFDSDETEEDTPSQSEPSHRVPKPKLQKPKNKLTCQTVAMSKPSLLATAEKQIVPAAVAMNYSAMAGFTPVAISPVDPQISMFLAEQRTHNSEMRMGLSTITDKLEKAVDKVSSGSVDKVLEQLQRVEQYMLSQFTTIHQQNCTLDGIVKFDQRNVEETTETICSKEETEIVEQLEKEATRLRKKLDKEKIVINKLETDIDELTASKIELDAELLTEQNTTTQLKKDNSAIIQDLNSKILDPYKFVQNVETSIDSWTEKVNSLEQTLNQIVYEEEDKTNDADPDESTRVMETMNSLYKLFKTKFKPNSEYTTPEIHSIFGSVFQDFGFEKGSMDTGYENGKVDNIPHSEMSRHKPYNDPQAVNDEATQLRLQGSGDNAAEFRTHSGTTGKNEVLSDKSRPQPPPPPVFDEMSDTSD